MSDPADFLRARFAEDEAERVIPDGDPGWPFTRSAHEVAESERWKAECEAKRQIVAEYESLLDSARAHTGDLATSGALLALHGVVKMLTLPYADHPDYRDEWSSVSVR